MKPRLHLTPVKVALVSLSGFLVAAASLPLTRFTHTHDASHCIRWIPVALVFGVFLLGGFVALRAATSLKNGVKNQEWSEEQIAPLRRWLESPLSNALLVLLLVAYAVLWLVFTRYRAMGLAGFLLMQVLVQLRNAVRRPRETPSSLIAGWRELSPIRSEHWGQR